jgi:hypothetical protein
MSSEAPAWRRSPLRMMHRSLSLPFLVKTSTTSISTPGRRHLRPYRKASS